MFQIQDVLHRPVEMKGDKGYLLEQAFEGVAYDPPGATPAAASTWNWVLQFGQVGRAGNLISLDSLCASPVLARESEDPHLTKSPK